MAKTRESLAGQKASAGKTALIVMAILAVITLWACSDPAANKSSSGNAAATNSGPVSALNTGKMAIETVRVNPGLAEFGAEVFKKRACGTCHAVGQRKQGPDLSGVASRRTEKWLHKQITDPEWMLKNDPIARELMAEYALQMSNQQVPEQEVKALIHYFVQESSGK
ncbi:MAG: c-type cytochrome [Candidatus Eisenbacteria bacterium]|uniref:C-type cytochrome n=1 Tax=Eiseniibacteriota bacterium TaxID=2212470 RepID=A0A7Y2EAI4_UNCEI|nr:c-type cytochrome [Candidatus Eisenbacteria bacterium]